MNKYEIIEKVGDGTFGVVYEGRNRETKEIVAIKKLKGKFNSLEECLAKTEVKILEKLHHENIVELKEVLWEKNGDASYIFEYCDCNLYEFIENHHANQKTISEPVIREIIMQITKGIRFLHSNLFFHRDLKPENILVILNNYDFNNTSNSGGLRIKIADFGTVKEIPLKNKVLITDYVCTRWYRAPECVLRGDYYDEKVDIWAIGCIFAELYKLEAIFQGENGFDQIQQILKILGTPTKSKWPWGYYQAEMLGFKLPVYYKKDFKKLLKSISNEGVNLLNEILQFDPSKRPSCNKILSHPYFKVINKVPINDISNSLRYSTKRNIISTRGDIINKNNEKPKINIKLNNKSNDKMRNNINKGKIPDNINKKLIKNKTNFITNLKDNIHTTITKNGLETNKNCISKIDFLSHRSQREENDKSKNDNNIFIKNKNMTQKTSHSHIKNNMTIIDNQKSEQINNLLNNMNKNIKSSRNNINNNIEYDITNFSSISSRNQIKNFDFQNISINKRKIKKPNFILNEAKSINLTKKIINVKGIKKEENKNNEIKSYTNSINNIKNINNINNIPSKKKFKVHIIKDNKKGENFSSRNNNNSSRKFSYFSGRRDDKESSINQSKNNQNNIRINDLSSNKEKAIKILSENRNINNLKKSNYKIVESVYNSKTNNNKNNNYNNIKSINNQYTDYINSNKINSLRKVNVNNSSSNAEIYVKNISLDKNKEKKENVNLKNLILNYRLDFSNSNSNSKSKNKNKKHHRFYESNGSKSNVLNYINNNNYHSYNCNDDINSDRQLRCNCGCFVGRNDSIKRNIIYNNNNSKNEINSYNLKNLGENYLNNKLEEPPIRQNSTRKKFTYQNQTFNPKKTKDLSNTLYSSFILTKNNGKFLFGKSQSLFKNSYNNLKRRINSQDYKRINNDDNCKSQVKVVNINLSEIESTNFTNTNNSNNNIININYNQRTFNKPRNVTISN